MKFTIGNLLIVTSFIASMLACAFVVPPVIGTAVLTLISLLVLPPFVWVGLINLRGRRQAFLVGAMIGGIPHFIYSAYFGTSIAFYLYAEFSMEYVFDQEVPRIFGYIHLIGICISCFGGLSGIASYRVLRCGHVGPVPTGQMPNE